MRQNGAIRTYEALCGLLLKEASFYRHLANDITQNSRGSQLSRDRMNIARTAEHVAELVRGRKGSLDGVVVIDDIMVADAAKALSLTRGECLARLKDLAVISRYSYKFRDEEVQYKQPARV